MNEIPAEKGPISTRKIDFQPAFLLVHFPSFQGSHQESSEKVNFILEGLCVGGELKNI